MSILPWSWNQRCDETNQIVVHVAWVPQGGRGHRHNRRYQLVNLKIDNTKLSHVVGGQKGCVEPGRVWGLQCEASLWQSGRGRCCPRRPRSQQPWQLLWTSQSFWQVDYDKEWDQYLSQPLQREKRVVGLHNHVTHLERSLMEKSTLSSLNCEKLYEIPLTTPSPPPSCAWFGNTL